MVPRNKYLAVPILIALQHNDECGTRHASFCVTYSSSWNLQVAYSQTRRVFSCARKLLASASRSLRHALHTLFYFTSLSERIAGGEVSRPRSRAPCRRYIIIHIIQSDMTFQGADIKTEDKQNPATGV